MYDVDPTSSARKALGVSATLNSPFGLWPLEGDTIFLRIRWCISTISFTLQVLLALYETHLDCDHAKNGVDNLLVIAFGLIGLSKMINYYVHRDKLRLNVESAIEDWASLDEEDYMEIMYNCKIHHNKTIHFYLAAGFVGSVGWLIKVFFINSESMVEVTDSDDDHNGNVTIVPGRKFVFPAACSFKNISQYTYRTIIFFQFIQFTISASVLISCDAFFVAITHHLGGQYMILKRKFGTFKELDSDMETREKFGVLISRHSKLLELSKLLEASFNMIILTNMIMNLILVNAAGFNFLLFLKKGEVLGTLTSITTIYSAMVQTFMYSYIGDDLSNHELNIALSVYNIEWYAMPRNLTKDIVLVISRARFLYHLTAGKFFKMTRSTFTDILRTAFSFLSILRIVINNRDIPL